MDLALNSLADDKLQATVRCIALSGALLEIGKYDILKGTGLSMRPLDRNISFHGINLDSMFHGHQVAQARGPPAKTPPGKLLVICLFGCTATQLLCTPGAVAHCSCMHVVSAEHTVH